MNDRQKKDIILAIGLIICMGTIYWWVGGFDKKPERHSTTQGEKHGEKSQTVRVGDVGVLRSKTGEVWVGATKDALSRMSSLAYAKDEEGLQQMLRSGQIAMVTNGTRCRVIQNSLLGSEVRLLSGPLSGKSVFIEPEFIFKE